jgi:GrpB-like predicted nucleotidyltransferase (UPF0157 family)/RimJ/RimL family protein N-acetyltransferase
MDERLLTDAVVTLREWQRADAPAIVECVAGDEELAGWLDRLPQPYTLDDALFYIEMEGEEKFAVTDAASGRVLGSIGIRWDEADSTAEIGYWLRRDAQGNGYMTRAAVLVSRYALAKGAARVFLRADPENVASCRVAEKAGFTREGVLRSAHWNPRLGRRQDWAIYSLLPVEYVGPRRKLERRLELREYDTAWPELYRREEARLRAVLGERVVRVAHVGSTAVPGLAAKPIVDIALEVADTRDEPAYAPDLEAAGYRLLLREAAWFEHRLFTGPDTETFVHVFPAGCEEFDRMVAFRDRLRNDDADRALYEGAKRDLVARDWEFMQDYADAKSAIVATISARAEAG